VGRLALLATVVSIGLLAAASARAAGVIVVRPANSPPVMFETLVRLKGELISAGFDTEIVDGPAPVGTATGDSRAGLEQLAARRGADAVVAIVGDLAPDSVEVWVIDKVTGKSVVRRLPFEPAAPGASKTLALRAIELLRSSFLEIDLAARDRQSATGAAAPAPPPAVVHFVEADRLARRPERFGIEVGAVAVMSVDGVGPALLPLARFDWALRPWFVAQATLAGLGTRPTVEGPAGTAQVGQAYGLLGGSVRFRTRARFRPFAALSAGALRTSVEGRAAGQNQSETAAQWSFLADAGAGAEVRVPDRFTVSLTVDAQLAEPYVGVRLVDTVGATLARPNLLVTLTVGAWL